MASVWGAECWVGICNVQIAEDILSKWQVTPNWEEQLTNQAATDPSRGSCRLEKWAGRNLLTFNRENAKSCPWGGTAPALVYAVHPRAEQAQGVLINVYKHLKAKRTEPGSSWWCPVAGPDTTGTSWNAGGSLCTSETLFSLQGWPNPGPGCSERLCSLHPWRYSRTWYWASHVGWPCLSRVEPEGPQSCL